MFSTIFRLDVILTVNAGADRFLGSFSKFMKQNRLDPHALTDSEQEIKYVSSRKIFIY